MRIGIHRHMLVSAGGGFQYELAYLDALSEIAPTLDHDLVCLAEPSESLRGLLAARRLDYGNLPVRATGDLDFRQSPPDAYINNVPPLPPGPCDPAAGIEIDREAGNAFRELGVDLLFQLNPSDLGVRTLLPFVTPIHDLQHRLQPEFPEVTQDGQAETRERLYRHICRHATLVLVDSDVGREHLLRFYGDLIDTDRIRVMPFFPPLRRAEATPADFARVRVRYDLPERYFFYPAQFWKHKNHGRIVEALAVLRAGGHGDMHVVFAGSYGDKWRARNFIEVMDLARRLGVSDLVHYLGFVPDRDMPALYTLSMALLMPTFFGPSNLPPLEAWSYTRPVITSDIEGIREQCREGALLVDPRDAGSIANAMNTLWNDPELGRGLADRGAALLASYSWAAFVGGVRGIVTDAIERVRAGRAPSYPQSWPSDD